MPEESVLDRTSVCWKEAGWRLGIEVGLAAVSSSGSRYLSGEKGRGLAKMNHPCLILFTSVSASSSSSCSCLIVDRLMIPFVTAGRTIFAFGASSSSNVSVFYFTTLLKDHWRRHGCRFPCRMGQSLARYGYGWLLAGRVVWDRFACQATLASHPARQVARV